MQVINESSLLIDIISTYKFQKKIIGLVPTMGALHRGHLQLIEKAKLNCDIVVCSIYINPTQFNNPTDLDKYPRSMTADLALLEENGCDFAFCPTDEEMFEKGNTITIDFGNIGKVLEGHFRPGHFNGVGLIVAKFLNIIQPDIAYFGQKDLQQFAIISSLVRNLNFNTQLIRVPTVRDKNGLALSSRNVHLSEEGKQKALTLHTSLNTAKNRILKNINTKDIITEIKALYHSNDIALEYFEIVNKDTFEKIISIKSFNTIAICVAAYVEGIRLIDNILINE
ncbi:MAG: pantoate--beta-alanine ligase [Cyclobacteriaceae bacterium]|nr:pantoate--beta-alanine ligase [Cyclobacteriaceae bacterium]